MIYGGLKKCVLTGGFSFQCVQQLQASALHVYKGTVCRPVSTGPGAESAMGLRSDLEKASRATVRSGVRRSLALVWCASPATARN